MARASEKAAWTFNGQPPSKPPLLTVLNFSGGAQSTGILKMGLEGFIKMPDGLVVLNADPGMESSETYRTVAHYRELCRKAGIHFETVKGPNLAADILSLKARGRVRLDSPPYFTKSPEGKRGKLRQKCTRYYKIEPMDRAIRRILHERFGISPKSSRMGHNVVEKWVGFTTDEAHRIKPPTQKYVYFCYPLIDLGFSKADVRAWFAARGLQTPARSVCNACFANGPSYYAEMARDRPADFAQAVAIDEAVRDWTQIGVKEPVYVSDQLRPLPAVAKEAGDNSDDWSCDSGYCFT